MEPRGCKHPPYMTAARPGQPWRRDAAIVLLVAGVLAGVGLSRVELIDPDEGRSAVVARAMAERGDWLAPHLPGEFHHEYPSYPVEGDQFAYWDKPPLYFWMAAAAMKAWGPTALAARLPSGLAMMGTALLAWAAGRALGGRMAGLWAGVVAATAPLVVVLGHTARMDALFVMLLTAGLLAAIKLLQNTTSPSPCPLPSRERGEEETETTAKGDLGETGGTLTLPSPSRERGEEATTRATHVSPLRTETATEEATAEETASPSNAGGFIRKRKSNGLFWMVVLYVSVGLGVLAKGPVAVALAAGAIGGTLVLCGRWRDIWRLRPVLGAVIVLVIAAPWFIYMHERYPTTAGQAGFTHVFFVEQHLHRATTGEYGHAASFPGVLLAVLLAGLVPWTIFLPGALGKLAGRGWRERKERPALLLVMVWAALVVVGFSLSSTQLFHYVAPAAPAVAILLGVYLAERTRGEDMDRLFVVGLWIAAGVVAAAGAAVIIGATYVFGLRQEYGLSQWLWEGMPVYATSEWAVGGVVGVACLVAGLLVAALFMAITIRGKQRRFPVIMLAGVTGLAIVVGFGTDPFDVYGTRSSHDECREIARQGKPSESAFFKTVPPGQVLAYPYTPYSMAWYLWPRHVPHPTADGTEDGQPTVEALYAQIEKGPGPTYCMIQKKSVARDMMLHFGSLGNGGRAGLVEVKDGCRRSPDHTLVVVEPAKQ